MEDKEKIIQKIRNLLALAENNPSMQEAAAAALKAQELMAKYHMECADFSLSAEFFRSFKGSTSGAFSSIIKKSSFGLSIDF